VPADDLSVRFGEVQNLIATREAEAILAGFGSILRQMDQWMHSEREEDNLTHFILFAGVI